VLRSVQAWASLVALRLVCWVLVPLAVLPLVWVRRKLPERPALVLRLRVPVLVCSVTRRLQAMAD
jgi:hypothetical protein